MHYWDSKDKKLWPEKWWRMGDVIIMIDPAKSEKESADFTAIVTVLRVYTPSGKAVYFVLDARRGRWKDPETVLEQAYIPYLRFKEVAPKVYVEDIAFQSMFVSVNKYMNEQRIEPMPLLSYDPLPDGRDKFARLAKSAPVWRDGRIFIDKSDNTQQVMVDEVVMFPADHDDLSDSLTAAINIFEYRQTRLKPPRIVRRVRDPRTGILREV